MGSGQLQGDADGQYPRGYAGKHQGGCGPGVVYYGEVERLSNATGAQYSIIPQDNSAGNFVKVEQRIPVKIVFTDRNSKEDIGLLRSGMNVECEVNY